MFECTVRSHGVPNSDTRRKIGTRGLLSPAVCEVDVSIDEERRNRPRLCEQHSTPKRPLSSRDHTVK